MVRECVWFDSFDVEVQGGLVYFVGYSDGVPASSRVKRSTAIKFANDINRAITAADLAELGVVLPFERAN